ncbi:HAD family phosphatase [Sediminibacterium sp.]|uniref:HAD family hydrolase n=1 Tax=Sediminibacterium sp. TaxID=1917865 RepID=UPI0027310EA4|nr:HAD family phosphatase [Sediminibacterium sp.]MDP2420568.1 HAD family phosphatase [Sediminibacterium sp.]
MTAIKHIIFDLGGVFLNINFQLTSQAFAKLGVTDFNNMFTQHYSNPLFELLETGKITEHEFYDAFREATKVALTNQEIKDAWNALLLDFPPERIQWLEQMAKKYNLYLFSNTNQIHYDCFMQQFEQVFNGKNFNDYFIKAYYSQDLGLRKPYPNAFEAILKEQSLNPADTLFIDDTIKNVEAAASLGMQTIHLAPPLTVLDLNL